MSKTKQILIDSRHGINGGKNPNRFKVRISSEYLTNVKKVSLIGLRTINSQTNITENNNVIDYFYGVDKQIVIPVGQYTVITFMTAVNGAQADFVISLNTLLSRFEWTSAGAPLTIKLNDKADEVVGLTEDLVDVVGGVTMLSPFIPDLSGLSMLYISSHSLGHSNSILSDSTTGDIISAVPINTPYGAAVAYDSDTRDDTDNHNFLSPQELSNIDIQLLTHNFKEAKLLSYVHIILKIYY